MLARFCAIVLLGTPILLTQVSFPQATWAETCASECPPAVLQFTPGQYIQLQILNKTGNVVALEKLAGAAPLLLKPGEKVQFRRGGATDPNVSVVFWDTTGVFLKAKLIKTGTEQLLVELRPGGENPGDRSVYIKNDGRVDIF
jgi:hypothetical protein